MPSKRLYSICLPKEDRRELRRYLRREKASDRVQTRARILLLADGGKTDTEIAKTLGVCRATANRIRKRYYEGGLNLALQEKPRSGAPARIDERTLAQLALLARSEPPDGRAGWTLELLADKLVEMGFVDSISQMSVHRLLKKMKLRLH